MGRSAEGLSVLIRRFLPLAELRVTAADDGTRQISWYPAVFDALSEDLGGFREKINRRAFTKTLQEADVRALFNHNPDYVLGRNRSQPTATLSLRVDLRGLHADVTPPDTAWARDLVTSVERGDISAGSFGFRVLEDKWTKEDDGSILRELREVQLFDVSLVTFPAYPDTAGTVALRDEERAVYQDALRQFAAIPDPQLQEEEKRAETETGPSKTLRWRDMDLELHRRKVGVRGGYGYAHVG